MSKIDKDPYILVTACYVCQSDGGCPCSQPHRKVRKSKYRESPTAYRGELTEEEAENYEEV